MTLQTALSLSSSRAGVLSAPSSEAASAIVRQANLLTQTLPLPLAHLHTHPHTINSAPISFEKYLYSIKRAPRHDCDRTHRPRSPVHHSKPPPWPPTSKAVSTTPTSRAAASRLPLRGEVPVTVRRLFKRYVARYNEGSAGSQDNRRRRRRDRAKGVHGEHLRYLLCFAVAQQGKGFACANATLVGSKPMPRLVAPAYYVSVLCHHFVPLL